MHLEGLIANNIKGKEINLKLEPLTVICGPHESGKTAALEAIRLAMVGKSSIGATGKKIAELVDGNNAIASVMADGRMSSSVVLVGDSVSVKTDNQLTPFNMPISPGDFWALSNAEKFTLISGTGIMGVAAQIDQCKAQIKSLKSEIELPSPAAPDLYVGPSRHELESEIEKLTLELAKHRAALDGYAKRVAAHAAAKRLAETKMHEIDATKESIRIIQGAMRKATSNLANLEDIRDRKGKAEQEEPWLVGYARRNNLCTLKLVNKICDDLRDACLYAARACQDAETVHELQDLAEELASTRCEKSFIFPPTTYDRMHESPVDLEAAIAEAKRSFMENQEQLEYYQSKLESASREVNEINRSIQTSLAIHGEPLKEELVSAIAQQKSELEANLAKCLAWDNWNTAIGNYQVRRSMAIAELAEKEDTLKRLLEDRNRIIASTVSPVEDYANNILKSAGLPYLMLEVEATPKRAELVVRTTDGIQLDALAGSRKLMYGICLLLAVQQKSKDECPVLLAQCAEMNAEFFAKCANAIKPFITKGNVILEHWLQGDFGCHTVNMEGINA